MKKKQIMALMMALAISGAVGVSTVNVDAAGLTQATDASTVVYRQLSKSDINILKDLFDFEYYKAANPELVVSLGDNYNRLFEHFCKCGVFEGRTCNPNFDPAAYASAYGDLKEKYGTDIMKYYQHYAAFGAEESRTLTTIAACAEAGITVEGLVNEDVRISPVVYKLALILGTNDFHTVQTALTNASSGSSSSSSGSSSSGSSSTERTIIQTARGTYVLMPEGGDDEAYAKANGLTKVGTISVGENYSYDGNRRYYDEYNIYIVKGDTGYAAYDTDDRFSTIGKMNEMIYQTSDYSGTPVETIGYYKIRLDNQELREEVRKNVGYENRKYYERTGEVTSSDISNGNKIETDYYYQREKTDHLNYRASLNSPVGQTATDYIIEESDFVGYYTNDEGTEIHRFADDNERTEYLDRAPYSPGYSFTGVDTKGEAETVYDVGIEIKQNEDGSLASVTIGVSSDETGFGYVSTKTAEELADPDTQQNESSDSSQGESSDTQEGE